MTNPIVTAYKEREKAREDVRKLLDDPRTGLRPSSDTNKTRSALLSLCDDRTTILRILAAIGYSIEILDRDELQTVGKCVVGESDETQKYWEGFAKGTQFAVEKIDSLIKQAEEEIQKDV